MKKFTTFVKTNNTMGKKITDEKLKIADVIKSTTFKKAIKDAIEYGKGTDWGFNGEDEYEFDTFDSDQSLHEVIRVLKEQLL